MKIVLVSIDSKYIHTNMALRYLKANLDMESDLMEFTIKDSDDFIYDQIVQASPDLIAFSIYLWNVEKAMRIIKQIKSMLPSLIVIGGPEVSFEPLHFMNHYPIDYIICGEGEFAFNELINALDQNKPISSISGLVYHKEDLIIQNKMAIIQDLNSLKNPYLDPLDIPNLPSRIQYIETSRGCPFHCSYCLASLENRVRFFDIERVKSDLLYLMNHGAKTFKFLDRTFNLKVDYALELFKFIIEHHREGTVFQFEITGDLLPKALIEFLNQHAPKGLFRFEIGIQSTNEATNLSVDRKQNNAVLFDNILLIQSAKIIDLHLDLIAGLPEENLERFAKTFDDVFSLYPKELQLGFLKMLRGTKIRREANQYGYLYDENPPYEIISNQVLSPKDIEEIHLTEEVLETFWNKGFMNQTFEAIIRQVPSAFGFMNAFGHYLLESKFDFHRFQLSDLFNVLSEYILKTETLKHPIIFDSLKYEYLVRSQIKPKIWWDNALEKADKNPVLKDFHKSHKTYNPNDLYKYAIVTPYQGKHLIVLYYPDKLEVIEYQKKR